MRKSFIAPPHFTRHAVALAVASVAAVGGNAFAATYAPWLTLIGVNDSILSAANWGKNQLLGVVDTGIVPTNGAFVTGQVSSALSSCAAVSFSCSKGFIDDNGHGTAVAEIAAGNKTYAYSST